MKRKIIILIAAVSTALAAVLFCALAPCVDGLTPFQAAGVKRFLKSSPFHAETAATGVSFSIAAGVGTDGYNRNTYIGSCRAMENSPGYIEVNLVAGADGRLVLADSYSEANEKSIDAYRVAKTLVKTTERTSLFVNLAEYTDLNAVSALLSRSSRFSNAVIRGVDENTIGYVRDYFPAYTILCEYSRHNRLSLSGIKEAGADGVYCSASLLSARFAKKVHDAGLALWVDCGGNAYRVIKAMSMAGAVDGIVTTKPGLALRMQRSWNYEEFKEASRV